MAHPMASPEPVDYSFRAVIARLRARLVTPGVVDPRPSLAARARADAMVPDRRVEHLLVERYRTAAAQEVEADGPDVPVVVARVIDPALAPGVGGQRDAGGGTPSVVAPSAAAVTGTRVPWSDRAPVAPGATPRLDPVVHPAPVATGPEDPLPPVTGAAELLRRRSSGPPAPVAPAPVAPAPAANVGAYLEQGGEPMDGGAAAVPVVRPVDVPAPPRRSVAPAANVGAYLEQGGEPVDGGAPADVPVVRPPEPPAPVALAAPVGGVGAHLASAGDVAAPAEDGGAATAVPPSLPKLVVVPVDRGDRVAVPRAGRPLAREPLVVRSVWRHPVGSPPVETERPGRHQRDLPPQWGVAAERATALAAAPGIDRRVAVGADGAVEALGGGRPATVTGRRLNRSAADLPGDIDDDGDDDDRDDPRRGLDEDALDAVADRVQERLARRMASLRERRGEVATW